MWVPVKILMVIFVIKIQPFCSFFLILIFLHNFLGIIIHIYLPLNFSAKSKSSFLELLDLYLSCLGERDSTLFPFSKLHSHLEKVKFKITLSKVNHFIFLYLINSQ